MTEWRLLGMNQRGGEECGVLVEYLDADMDYLHADMDYLVLDLVA
jgi:hypothetical protein